MAKDKPQQQKQAGTHRKPVFGFRFLSLLAPFLSSHNAGTLVRHDPEYCGSVTDYEARERKFASNDRFEPFWRHPGPRYFMATGGTFHEAFILLVDVYMWLAMFGGAGIATFLTWSVPVCVYAIYDVQAKSSVRKLLKQQRKLVEEWGAQVGE